MMNCAIIGRYSNGFLILFNSRIILLLSEIYISQTHEGSHHVRLKSQSLFVCSGFFIDQIQFVIAESQAVVGLS